jgi:hypothetical protein
MHFMARDRVESAPSETLQSAVQQVAAESAEEQREPQAKRKTSGRAALAAVAVQDIGCRRVVSLAGGFQA